ncbi:MAG: hypothetical protein HYX60_11525 [Legionella longbeachae]|nr:hypothetical protein [Legionella longbeachae]
MMMFRNDKTKNNENIDEERKQLNILCYSADVDSIDDFLKNNNVELNYNGGEPLIFAIRSMVDLYPSASPVSCLNSFKKLVENGADIHINDDLPIKYAMRKGVHIIVQYLLENGRDFQLDENEVMDYLEQNDDLDPKIRRQLTAFTPKIRN